MALVVGTFGQSHEADSRSKAPQLKVRWNLVTNEAAGENPHESLLTLVVTGGKLDGDWSLYFNCARPIHSHEAPKTRIEHVNGDLFRMVPGKGKANLSAGESLAAPMHAPYAVIKNSDAPSGFFIGYPDGSTFPVAEFELVPLPKDQLRQNADDIMPVLDAAGRFQKNTALTQLPADKLPPIMPTPVQVKQGSGVLKLKPSLTVTYEEGLENEASLLARGVTTHSLKTRKGKGGDIHLALGYDGPAESYELTIAEKSGVHIIGHDAAGVFYGTQSLLSVMAGSAELGEMTVTDYPRFPYRGMHIDVARNFQPMDVVKRMLDVMALYKLNKFHFHLTDDEGWRLEIPGLPELTEIGGRRGHDPSERTMVMPSWGSGPNGEMNGGSGWYSRAQFMEILRYAKARHIEVIPEIDLPGHARAAIVAMKARHIRLISLEKTVEAEAYLLHDPKDASKYESVQMWDDNVINVCRESSYRFIEKVVDEIIAMYREADVPLTTVHIGGDEVPKGVWSDSPMCGDKEDLFAYFLERVHGIFSARGLKTAGWEEIALDSTQEGHKVNKDFAHKGFVPYVWNAVSGWGSEDVGYRLANEGFETVLCNVSNLYFDLAYDKHPLEPGFYWGGFTDTRKPFEFIPLDLYKSSRQNKLGHAIPAEAFADKVRLTEQGKKNIVGIQGQLWGESARTPDQFEYLAYPKLLGLAERAWAPDPLWAKTAELSALEHAWNTFANILGQKELARLDGLGVGYRLPPPGAVVEKGVLRANSDFPGLTIRYTLDGSEPDGTSSLYEGPVPVTGAVKLRSFSRTGRGSRTVTVQ